MLCKRVRLAYSAALVQAPSPAGKLLGLRLEGCSRAYACRKGGWRERKIQPRHHADTCTRKPLDRAVVFLRFGIRIAW